MLGHGLNLWLPAMGGAAFSPASLFSGGAVGAWYDPSDITTLFKDVAGTIPVTTAGDEVLRMSDKSGRGYHATGTAGTSFTYAIDGAGKPYLNGTGLQFMRFSNAAYGTTSPLEIAGAATLTANGNFPSLFGGNSTSTGVFFGLGSTADRKLRVSLAGGTGGSGANALGSFAIPLSTPFVTSMRYDNTSVLADFGGILAATVARTGTFAPATEGRIGFTAAPITSPIRFYGGVIIQSLLSSAQRSALTQYLAEKNGTAPGPTTAYALGDSTVEAYLGGTAIMDLLTSAYSEVTLAVPGHTIAQQKAAWLAHPVALTTPKWVVIQAGLNDLAPGEAAATAIARLQDLVATVRLTTGAGAKIFVSQMIPCRARLITVNGAIDGPIAYQKWLDMNTAIAGGGATPITGVDGRVTAHVALMNDGAGNLLGSYDTGDGIHPNTAGRTVNATEWVNALTAAGVTV